MDKFKINSWQDYWALFDKLIDKLSAEKKDQIVAELKNAQRIVNGLTDGWYEFKFAFEKSLKSNRSMMTQDQLEIADFLILSLNKSLKNR
jgi:hypothetical protein